MKQTKERPAILEFNMAWEEYFKDKPRPKNAEAGKKELEEFYHWYNFVRKQNDTGKTPAEMYKEAYGEEPPETNGKLGLDFGEEDYDEAAEDAKEFFEKEVWRRVKAEMKELNRKEACKSMFSLGFLTCMKLIEEQIEFKHEEEE